MIDNMSCGEQDSALPRKSCISARSAVSVAEVVLVAVTLVFIAWLSSQGHAPRTAVGVALVVVVVVVLVPRVEPRGVRGLLLRLAGPVPEQAPGGRG